ncbi:MAG: hypothetical protein IPF46_07275 [Saprospiraceae bacterium]|nr:hypothetical protein [Candidatus Vicinibacter affinis]
MKNYQYYSSKIMQTSRVLMLVLLCFSLKAQEETQGMEPGSQKAKLVKNTFESNWILDNQSVMVPIKGTLEMDIQHRFGVVNNGMMIFMESLRLQISGLVSVILLLRIYNWDLV